MGVETGTYAVIIFTFISIFLLPSGNEGGMLEMEHPFEKKSQGGKWHQGSTYR